MTLQILLFGITTDLLNTSSLQIEITNGSSVLQLKQLLVIKYPVLKNIASYAVAINEKYASDNDLLKENDVIAIIPPVSGG